jgi:hypothetical protein
MVSCCLLPLLVGCRFVFGAAMQLGSATASSIAASHSGLRVLLGDSTWQCVEQSPQTIVFCTPGGSMTSAGMHPSWARNDAWLGRFLCWAASLDNMPVFFGVVPPLRSCPAHAWYADAAQALSLIPTGNSIVLPALLDVAAGTMWCPDRIHLTLAGVRVVVSTYFNHLFTVLVSSGRFQPGSLLVVLADGWNEKKLRPGDAYCCARAALLQQTSLAGVLQVMRPFTCSSLMQRPTPCAVSILVGTRAQRGDFSTFCHVLLDHINIGRGYMDVYVGDCVNCHGPLQPLPEANPRTAVRVHKVVLGSDGFYFMLDRVAPEWVLSSYLALPNALQRPSDASWDVGFQLVHSEHIDIGRGFLNVHAGDIVHCAGPLQALPGGIPRSAYLVHKVFVCSDGCYTTLDDRPPALVLSSHLVPAPKARERFSC